MCTRSTPSCDNCQSKVDKGLSVDFNFSRPVAHNSHIVVKIVPNYDALSKFHKFLTPLVSTQDLKKDLIPSRVQPKEIQQQFYLCSPCSKILQVLYDNFKKFSSRHKPRPDPKIDDHNDEDDDESEYDGQPESVPKVEEDSDEEWNTSVKEEEGSTEPSAPPSPESDPLVEPPTDEFSEFFETTKDYLKPVDDQIAAMTSRTVCPTFYVGHRSRSAILTFRDTPFQCPFRTICFYKTFNGSSDFVRHLQCHLIKTVCVHCHIGFANIDYLNSHMCPRHDGPRPTVSQSLTKTFVLAKDIVKCPLCPTQLVNSSYLPAHLKRVHQMQEKPTKPILTGKRKSNTRSTVDDDSMDSESPPSSPKPTSSKRMKIQGTKKCNWCHPPKEFTNLTQLLEHLTHPENHTKPKVPCNCSFCELTKFLTIFDGFFVFKSSPSNCGPTGNLCPTKLAIKEANLQVYLKKEPPYKCPVDKCDSIIPSEYPFLSHIHQHLSKWGKPDQPVQPEGPVKCPKCSREFPSIRHARVHIFHCGNNIKRNRKKRAVAGPAICDVCGKSCPTKSKLKVHLYTHSTERNFVCETCGRAFKRQADLNSHMVWHSEERPFICDQCGKTYKTRESVKFHQNISHSEEGRKKYNEYCRLKNQSRRQKKLKEAEAEQRKETADASDEDDDE